MDNQLAVTPPSAAHARPQQPADSPAAALPFETLHHILQLAREDSSPPDAARTLKSFSLVCKLWNDVAQRDGRGELFVASSQQAERLTRALQARPTAEWREEIRSAVIQVEWSWVVALYRSGRIGRLLLTLPRLERLYLELQDPLVGSQSSHHPFGESLSLALQRLPALTHVHLELGAEVAQIDISAMYSMLGCWPNLRNFTATSLQSRQPYGPGGLAAAVAPDLVSALPTRLQSIHMGRWTSPDSQGYLFSNANASLLFHLLVKSGSTVRSLQLGSMHEDVLLSTVAGDSRSLSTLLEEVAPRLRLLDVRDEPRPSHIARSPRPDYIVNIIEKLALVRTLTLGLGGVPFDDLFPLLGRLTTLVDLFLVSDPHSLSPTDYELDPQAVASFINHSRQLRSLKLPSSHCEGWSAEERRAVESAADAAGVCLRFAPG